MDDQSASMSWMLPWWLRFYWLNLISTNLWICFEIVIVKLKKFKSNFGVNAMCANCLAPLGDIFELSSDVETCVCIYCNKLQCNANFLQNPLKFQRHPIAPLPVSFCDSNSDIYSTSVTAIMYSIPCYIGLRYNGTQDCIGKWILKASADVLLIGHLSDVRLPWDFYLCWWYQEWSISYTDYSTTYLFTLFTFFPGANHHECN